MIIDRCFGPILSKLPSESLLKECFILFLNDLAGWYDITAVVTGFDNLPGTVKVKRWMIRGFQGG